MSDIKNLEDFSQIEIIHKLKNVTFIGEVHPEKSDDYQIYQLAKCLREQYKSCLFSCFKTEILIEDYNISTNMQNNLTNLPNLINSENHFSFIANYLAKNNCNVTKCDYRKSFPFYLSIINKNINDIADIVSNVSKIIEHIEKREFPLMIIQRIKDMNSSMNYFNLENNAPLIRIIRSIINKNINGKSYRVVLTRSFNELKSALIVFTGLPDSMQINAEMWNDLKRAFEKFCDTFPLFFSFIIEWVFLFYMEKYKRSNIVVYAGSQHIKSLIESLENKEKKHKLYKHLDI